MSRHALCHAGQRRRTREAERHQAAAAKVVAAHGAAVAKFDATSPRRNEIVAVQDALVAATHSEVRLCHCGAILTAAALQSLPSEANRTVALARIAEEVGSAADRLGPKGRERYVAAAAEVLAPVAVNIGDRGG
jgi:hypothetical protein